MATVFLDGAFVSAGDARVSAFDAGFQHGVGLFETLLALRHAPADAPGYTRLSGSGGVLHLGEHLDRLAASSRALGLLETIRVDALHEAVVRTCDRAFIDQPNAARLRVRLTITGGDLNMLDRGKAREHAPTLMIAATPASVYPRDLLTRGASVVLADLRLNPLDPLQGHKTLSYWGRLRELQRASTAGAGEALVLQVSNHLAGGCVSNAFLVRDGVLITPIARGEETLDQKETKGNTFLPSPVLPGIARRWVMDVAAARNLEVQRKMIAIGDVLDADELFLTNSSWGVLPVVRVEAKPLGSGEVGPVSRSLVEAWAALAP
ncbi:MAG: aminotransferase class IV [Phycisphaerales bacterium]|jgi:branched-chain amino acid aminotransferase|nr:aminotransferase class IV [Phycisphaerales bacterium]